MPTAPIMPPEPRQAVTIACEAGALWQDHGTSAAPFQAPPDWSALDLAARGFRWSISRQAGGRWQPHGPMADRIAELLPEVRALLRAAAGPVRLQTPDVVVEVYHP